MQEVQPDEVYNLAAQSHVGSLLHDPGVHGKRGRPRDTAAARCEPAPRVPRPDTVLPARSPYGAAKLYSYWNTVNYREVYEIFAASGILFNHESEIRGETFVTRKITRAAAHIAVGLEQTLFLGNLDAKRDWGYVMILGEIMSARSDHCLAEVRLRLGHKLTDKCGPAVITGVDHAGLVETQRYKERR